MAANKTYVRNRLYNINLADLQSDPNQPRKYLDPTALDELTASIVQHGVLEPILFRQENSILYIVAGERRVAAAKKAGLATIPAVFIDGSNSDEIALVENLLRQDLNPVEEAEALERLMKDHKYKQEDLTRILGKSKAIISETLSLNRLPDAIRNECRQDPSVPKNMLIKFARKKQERSMLSAYQDYKASLIPKKKTQTGSKVSKAQSAFDTMDRTGTVIRTLEVQALSPEERENFVIALHALQQIIETVLVVATQPAPEDDEEQKPSKKLA